MDEVISALTALRRAGVVTSERVFAERYLGRSESYLSVLRATGGEVSLSALTTLHSRLRRLLAETRAVTGEPTEDGASRGERVRLEGIILRLQDRIDRRACAGRPR